MKNFTLLLTFALFFIQSKAQVITGLDEVALLGTWNSVEYAGVWENIDYSWPLSFEFNDNRDTYITVKSNRETEPRRLVFNGYWIGGTVTGHYTLHFLCRREYGSNYTGLSMVNFVIKKFDGETLIIETYDGSGTAEFIKSNSGIENVSADYSEASSTLYNLNGVSVKNPTTHGIYIQSDGKKVVK